MVFRTGLSDTPGRRFTIDHKHPRGVPNSDVVGACLDCNNAKGDLPFALFVDIMARAPNPADGRRQARALISQRDAAIYAKSHCTNASKAAE